MYKLLIVDDEPLIQIGIKSMINWSNLDIEVCGTAVNGANALDMIKEFSPEIVITDIRMPIMNGLELVKKSQEIYGKIPLFIVLTSFEEFQLVREALSYQVVDYLVKLELDEETLSASIERVLERLRELRTTQGIVGEANPFLSERYHDKFYLRLLHNLFDSEEQFYLQVKELNLDFSDRFYAATHCEIRENSSHTLNSGQLINLCNSTLQMMREILNKHLSCQIISLDMKHFSIIFHFPEESDYEHHKIEKALVNACDMVRNYFNVLLLIGIGIVVDSPLKISDSYQTARIAILSAGQDCLICDFNQVSSDVYKNSFNISIFKNDVTRAFEEFNTNVLYNTLTEIMDIFMTNPTRYLQAMDGACNILYLAISLLPDGEEIMNTIFSDDPDGYRSIYRLSSVEQVVEWLTVMRDGLCEALKSRRVTYKEYVINNVQKYIQNHIEQRLTLNDVSGVFGLTPNYLSVLFKKTCNIGFSEYINQMKINQAKTMLREQNIKVYEVADKLGFEDAFYFSRVFKKVTGVSPREYIQKCGKE